jgi:4-carboxymuconolactone decarboxylase
MGTPADQTYRDVMGVDPPSAVTPFDAATRDFVFGQVWPRPGLSRRDRRLVTLACVYAADATGPIDDHIYAALATGDLTLEEMGEVTLQFAVYCGWPKASQVDTTIRVQWARLHKERGEEPPPFPMLSNESLGVTDHEERLTRGAQEFLDVNFWPGPPRDSPYYHAGILNFVFGHVWQRPGLSRRDRRLVTVACVGLDDSVSPIRSHIGSALKSRDISYEEMQEVILQFSAYYGFAKGEFMNQVAAEEWARILKEEAAA